MLNAAEIVELRRENALLAGCLEALGRAHEALRADYGGAVLGGTFVAVFMALALIGGLLATFGRPKEPTP